jgi:hypothetical protein
MSEHSTSKASESFFIPTLRIKEPSLTDRQAQHALVSDVFAAADNSIPLLMVYFDDENNIADESYNAWQQYTPIVEAYRYRSKGGTTRQRDDYWSHPVHLDGLQPLVPRGRASGGRVNRHNSVGNGATEWFLNVGFDNETLLKGFSPVNFYWNSLTNDIPKLPLSYDEWHKGVVIGGQNAGNLSAARKGSNKKTAWKFRISIQDPDSSDPRDRIYGPFSKTVFFAPKRGDFFLDQASLDANKGTTYFYAWKFLTEK